MIALIVGPDAASAREEVQRIVREHDQLGLNTVRLDGKSVTISEVAGAAGTPSFFGGARVVIVDDLMARFSRGGKNAGEEEDTEDRSSESNSGDIARLFSSVAESNVLILVDQSLTTIPAQIKKSAPQTAHFFGGEPPRGHALIVWITSAAEKAQTSIDDRAARTLAERTFPQTWTAKPSNPAYDRPPDLDRLRNEIEKLALAAHPGPIGTALVSEMVASAAEDRLFPFVEAVVTSQLRSAIPAYEGLQSAGDDSGRLVAQIYQQIELGAMVPAAGAPTDPATIGKDLALSNPNRMIGVARTARRGRTAPPEMLKRGLIVDRATKSGRLRHGDDAVYHLMTIAAAVESDLDDERGGN